VRQISPGKPGANWHCESRSSAIVRAGVSGGSDHVHSRTIRPRRAPSQLFRRPIRVIRRRLSMSGVPLPATELSQPGRIAGSFPLAAIRRRSWGSIPSQVCSHRRVTRDASIAASIADVSISSDPRVVCASHPTRFIFVGLIAPFESGREQDDVDFWASLPSAVRIPGSHLAGDRSCLGLCLLQGWRALCCATVRFRHRIGSSASGTR
jgi:hypothetical protein